MALIYEQIPKIMEEVSAITKSSKNLQQGFMYRGVDAVMNAFQPALKKHGVFVVPVVLSSSREERQTARGGNLIYTILTVKFVFYATDGSFVEAIVQGEGMDSADKSSNKAMSVAYKYALFQTFCVPTEEMKDPDADSPEPSTPKQYCCAECGKPFGTYTDKNGKVWQPRDIYVQAQMKNPDKVARCGDCRRKREATVEAK